MRMHRLGLLLGVGLLAGCIHNWSAYEPADTGVPFDNVMLDVQPIDIPRPDVPDVMDVQMPVDVVDTTPPPDVIDVPPPMDIVDAPPPVDVVDVPIVPDVPPPVDVNPDAPCGANGAACCTPMLCAPGLFCRGDMTCGTTCAPLTQCGSACFDTQNDSNNCGSCGTSCSGGRHCSAGMCIR